MPTFVFVFIFNPSFLNGKPIAVSELFEAPFGFGHPDRTINSNVDDHRSLREYGREVETEDVARPLCDECLRTHASREVLDAHLRASIGRGPAEDGDVSE